ncbi:MAG: lipopolysaccharide export system permease protein [Motiliproteus sp.]|jgi:lipopolysaccharide export system permease protein
MKLLDRYIGKTVLFSCLIVLLAIIGLDTLFSFVDELKKLSDSYTLDIAVRFVLLSIPGSMYEFIPLSCLVGCLIGLGLLASSSELTVMRAAGVSKFRIVLAVSRPVVLLVVLAGLIGEFVVPVTGQQATVERAKAHSGDRAAGTQYGVWHRESNWVMHFNAIERDGTVHGLTLYEFNSDRQLIASGFAEKALYQQGNWQLKQLRTTYFEGDRTRVEIRDDERWDSELKPELLELLSMEPQDMSIEGLYHFNQYMNSQHLKAAPHQLAFWSKLLQPLAIFSLVLVAVSFVFGSLRSVTMGQRVLVGILVGLVFKFSQDLLGPASTVYGFSPLVAILSPIIICVLAGSWMLHRGR